MHPSPPPIHPASAARSPRSRGIVRELSSLLTVIAVVLAARTSLADHYLVPSGSMEPTVRVGDHILVNKLAYGVRLPLMDRYALEYASPARGDVVVLTSPEDGRVLLKRVVAVPEDMVRVSGGTLTINGARVAVEERGGTPYESLGANPHPLDLEMGGGPDFGPVRVPPRHFLVLGDHRGDSKDGRYFGFVDADAILGRSLGVCVSHGSLTWRDL